MLGQLGAQPDNPCYDPNRSSLLPYWINNSNEQACLNKAENSVSVLDTLKQLIDPSYIPTIHYTSTIQAATSPQIPRGYDPVTGTVNPANTTGGTMPPPPFSIADQLQGAGSESWYCKFLGVGCKDPANAPLMGGVIAIAAVVGVGLLIAAGGRR